MVLNKRMVVSRNLEGRHVMIIKKVYLLISQTLGKGKNILSAKS